MKIIVPVLPENFTSHKKLSKKFTKFIGLITELNEKELPEHLITTYNENLETLASLHNNKRGYNKQLNKTKNLIFKTLETNLKIVPKNYYQNKWMVLGMSIFGIPIGTAFGVSVFKNPGFLSIGIPIGMAVGIAIGNAKDKEAKNNGLQLDTVIF